MKIVKVYLGGKMSGLSFEEMNGWRLEATKQLKKLEVENSFNKKYDIICQNPCDYYNFEMDSSTYTEHEIKRFDLWLVKNCDIVLVNLDYPDSIGTAIECHEAHDNWYKPVIGFGTKKAHPWIELSLTKKCKTLEEVIDHIDKYYLVNI